MACLEVLALPDRLAEIDLRWRSGGTDRSTRTRADRGTGQGGSNDGTNHGTTGSANAGAGKSAVTRRRAASGNPDGDGDERNSDAHLHLFHPLKVHTMPNMGGDCGRKAA